MAHSTNRVSVWADSKDKLGHLSIQRQQRSLRGPFGPDHKLGFLLNNNPWNVYTKVIEMQQGGPVIVASSRTKDPKFVAIRELKGYKMADFKNLVKPANENIVQLHSAFFWDLTIYLVYEDMDVPLNDILSTPRGRLPHQEVATVCRSILSGLNYIHSEMDAAHGNINGSTVLLLVKNGKVKIACIVEQLLSRNMHPAQSRDKKLSQKEDIHAVASLIVKMNEPDTIIQDPRSRELQRPSQSHETVDGILGAMQVESCSQLLEHEFLREARENFYLMPYALAARNLSHRAIKVFTT